MGEGYRRVGTDRLSDVEIPRVRYAEVAGASIAYQVFGDGPPDLLVTPGFVSHLDLQWTIPSYTRFFEMLSSVARVIIFDKRGTGLSDPAPGAIRFDQRADDIVAVMDAAESDQTVLMGVSEGGPLSVIVAAKEPERVTSLILYGTFAKGTQLGGEVFDSFSQAIDSWGSGLTADIFSTTDRDQGWQRRLAGVFERASASPGMARALVNSVRQADVSAVLPTIEIPCLVINRRDDPFAPAHLGQEMARSIPDSRMEVLEGFEHLPWFGDYASIARVVAEFLGTSDLRSPPRRRLATIMFTDIVDSTVKAIELGDEAWTDLLERHNVIMQNTIEDWKGEEVKTLGDGVLALFDSSARAIECGHDAMSRLEDLSLNIRAGVHTGDVEILGDDVAGKAVHLAARIAALAGPGEVLVSSTVRELSAGSSIEFRAEGEHELKGFPGSWQLYSAARPSEEIIVDLREPKALNAVDHISLFLARRAPGALRSLAGLASDAQLSSSASIS